MNKGKWILKCLTAGIILLLLVGTVTMLLWNWLIPALFNGPELRFFEALGLLLLAKILFGGWGGRSWRNSGAPPWKQKYYEKLSSMSPEQRERFKDRMREKWCSHGRHEPESTGNAGGANV
jgi:hypothetical protein